MFEKCHPGLRKQQTPIPLSLATLLGGTQPMEVSKGITANMSGWVVGRFPKQSSVDRQEA